MSLTETHVLVELEAVATPDSPTDYKRDIIKRVLRTYLSADRAEEDLALLRDATPDARFAIQHVEHIDN